MKPFNFSELYRILTAQCVCVCVLVSLRRSVLFPLISLVILLVGEIIAIFSHYDRRKKVLTFVSGILFVIAGK